MKKQIIDKILSDKEIELDKINQMHKIIWVSLIASVVLTILFVFVIKHNIIEFFTLL